MFLGTPPQLALWSPVPLLRIPKVVPPFSGKAGGITPATMANPSKTYPYKQARLAEEWDAIVIGSGIGGLTAAALLSVHSGKRVLVLERHYVAGGFTHSFHRPGYEWDVGLHYIGQVQDEQSAVRRAFDHITDGAVRWSATPEMYDRAVIDGRIFNFTAGIERFREHEALLPA